MSRDLPNGCTVRSFVEYGAACGRGNAADVCWSLSVKAESGGFDPDSCEGSLDKDKGCSSTEAKVSVFEVMGPSEEEGMAPASITCPLDMVGEWGRVESLRFEGVRSMTTGAVAIT